MLVIRRVLIVGGLWLAIFVVICDGESVEFSTPYIVHDEVRLIKPTNQHGAVIVSTSVPDWRAVTTDGRIRYIEMLIIADSGVSKYYGRDMKKLRRAVTTLMQALDLFIYQIGVRMVVVDVIEMSAYNVTLEQFADYRIEKFTQLPEHDLAVLISSTYEGGIAYVNGICGRSAVGIIGSFADAPMEYASIFFHELAHLLGLSHDAAADCSCDIIDSDEGCLKIVGFDNDCSLQALVERLPDHVCIQSPPASLPKTALPVCGNQIIEHNEECDCGPERFCKSLICNPATCMRTISDLQLLTVLTGITSAVSLSLYCMRKCRRPRKPQLFSQANVNVNNKVWDTPTFMPLVSSLSDSQAPIWNASMLTEDSSSFATPQSSPMKVLNAPPMTSTPKRGSVVPPLPPRLVNYANISPAKSTDNIPLASTSVVPSTPRSTQTLGRQPRRAARIMRQQSQSPLLVHSYPHRCVRQSPQSPYVPISELLEMSRDGSSEAAAHSRETKCERPTTINLASRRLVFSTDSSQEIPMVPTTSVEYASPSTILDQCIQLPKTPEKERQHRELIAALSQCLLAEESVLNKKIRASPPTARIYPLLPADQHPTISLLPERSYDTPAPSDKVVPLVTAKCGNNSDDHLVKLSFTPRTNCRTLSAERHCNRSSSFNTMSSASNNDRIVEDGSRSALCSKKLHRSTGNVGTSNRRPKVPPPPPPPPPHASKAL